MSSIDTRRVSVRIGRDLFDQYGGALYEGHEWIVLGRRRVDLGMIGYRASLSVIAQLIKAAPSMEIRRWLIDAKAALLEETSGIAE